MSMLTFKPWAEWRSTSAAERSVARVYPVRRPVAPRRHGGGVAVVPWA